MCGRRSISDKLDISYVEKGMKEMEDKKWETGEVIETYVYRKDEPTELIGTYKYNTSSLIFFTGIVIVVGIICYWLGKKKR